MNFTFLPRIYEFHEFHISSSHKFVVFITGESAPILKQISLSENGPFRQH